MLILDEIQTGIGRTGKMFYFEHVGIKPDILTVGKGLGGGVPLAALLATEAASCFSHGDQGGTFNGNPLMCAAGIAVLGEVSPKSFLDCVTEKGEILTASLARLANQYRLGEVRGRGLLQALALGKPVAAEIAAKAFEAGLLLNAPGPDSLRFMPSLTVAHDEIEQMAAILDEILCNMNGGT